MYRVEIQDHSYMWCWWGLYAKTLLGAKRLGTQYMRRMPSVHCIAIFQGHQRICFKSRSMRTWRMASDFNA